jgi:hypothetical protein
MKKVRWITLAGCCLLAAISQAQSLSPASYELAFVSDTQQPMWVEKLLLKPHHNLTATAGIFQEIIRTRPQNVYMLGDVVSLGFKNGKWKKADQFLDSCRKAGIVVNGLLGNHELIGRRKKGELNFAKRFPLNVRTGYVSIADSVAVVLLNSNFSSLSESELALQQSWYTNVLAALDATDSIASVIVACHHAPFSNSKIVGSSSTVQQHFVPAYIQSKKAVLFLTGHAHVFEHFNQQGKDFVVIGGGGGLNQPVSHATNVLTDFAAGYKPMFHYLTVHRVGQHLQVTSRFLNNNFVGFEKGYSFMTKALL